jgi:DNA-binding CsgD family transcriptional regulator
MHHDKKTMTAGVLRRTAEKVVAAQAADAEAALKAWDAKRLYHELQVHQIELEMQHAELLESQNALDLLLQELTNLYDFAPTRYLTLDLAGSILKGNFAAASFIGLPRSELSGQPLTRFVDAADRPQLASFLERVFGEPSLKQTCRLQLLQVGAGARPTELEAQADATGMECLLAIIDATAGTHTDQDFGQQARLRDTTGSSPGSAARRPVSVLSPRERDTLKFVAEGNTNSAIAELMNISPKSVETYRSRLMLKLGINNVPDLVKYALLYGVISL